VLNQQPSLHLHSTSQPWLFNASGFAPKCAFHAPSSSPPVNRLWTVLPASAGLTYMDMPLLQTTIQSIQKNQVRAADLASRTAQLAL
jgi:hypothetical protein